MVSPTNTADTERIPRLSIGMAVYNGEKYLAQSLDSLLAQTYRDFELIISDNASTDATEAICRRYAAADARVRYVRQPENCGSNENFNRAFRLGRGELFKWAAHDDLHDPTFLERCVGVLDRDPSVVAVHTRTAEIGPAGERLLRKIDGQLKPYNTAGPAELATSTAAHRRFRDVLLTQGWGVRTFGVFRRNVLERTGLFKPHFGWEKIMMAELALMGRFHLIDEPLFLQRVHPDAMSQLNDAGRSRHYRSRSLPRFAYLKGYLGVAWRLAPSYPSMVLCFIAIGVYLLQVRKWPAVIRMLLRPNRPASNAIVMRTVVPGTEAHA